MHRNAKCEKEDQGGLAHTRPCRMCRRKQTALNAMDWLPQRSSFLACASLVDGGATLGPTKQPTRKDEREIKHLHYKNCGNIQELYRDQLRLAARSHCPANCNLGLHKWACTNGPQCKKLQFQNRSGCLETLTCAMGHISRMQKPQSLNP